MFTHANLAPNLDGGVGVLDEGDVLLPVAVEGVLRGRERSLDGRAVVLLQEVEV